MDRDYGRERRARELGEEISRLKIEAEARRKRRKRTGRTKFDDLIEELGKIPGVLWDDDRDRDQFMTCQGFAPAPRLPKRR